MGSFHSKQNAALAACDKLIADHPALKPQAAILEAHYLHGGTEKVSPNLYYAALCLVAAPTYKEGARFVSLQESIQIDRAEGRILEAVNNGPDALKNDEDYLHAKGIVRGAGKYHLGVKGIHTGSTYDRAWRNIDRAHRPIVAEAVTGCMSQKHRILDKVAMQYVAVLLMPEGDEKLFLSNKLSMKHESKHGAYVRQASAFIRAHSASLGISVSESLLVDGAHVHSSAKMPAVRPAAKKEIADPKQRGNAFAGVPKIAPAFTPVQAAAPVPAQKTKNASGNEAAALVKNLRTLVERGKITEKGAKRYLWLHSGTDEDIRTIPELARKSGKSEGHIRILVGLVNSELGKLEQVARPKP